MLDPKLLRDNPDAFKDAATKKRVASPAVVDAWLVADERRRGAQTKADTLRAEQGKIGGEVGKLKGKLKGGTSPELEALLAKATDFKTQNESIAVEQSAFEKEAAELMLQLPAIPDASWPVGKDDADNVVVREWSVPGREPRPLLREGQLDHIKLGESLNIIDFARGVKVGGSRAYVMRGAGAQLYNAALRFAMDTLIARGWEPFVVPVLVTEACMTGTGYFPTGRDQAYITQDASVLTGTSEVALASYLGDEIIDLAKPKRMVAMSTCFRREAGAAGRDTAGLYRVHQFDKVEQVVVHAADEAEHIAIHEEIIANSEHLLQQLGLAYRVVQNCTGDMGQGKWRMYDIETWMPSRNAYGETHSGSALRDFQSRRLNLRYRKPNEKSPTFAFTLNNTAIACPRVLIAILETYQQPNGTVTVPEVLRPYMNGVTTIGA